MFRLSRVSVGVVGRHAAVVPRFNVIPTITYIRITSPLDGNFHPLQSAAVRYMHTSTEKSEPIAKTPFTKNSVQKKVHDWLFPRKSKIEVSSPQEAIRKMMELCDKDKLLPKELLLKLLDVATKKHQAMPNVLQIRRTKQNRKFTGKLTIVGDTHGQYNDFAQIFKFRAIGGYPTEHNQFVFNGDLVDRGPKAVEILTVLLFAKLLCPISVHILRGNHETKQCSQVYGFKDEVLRKYDAEVYEKFLELFDTLPIAAVVENSVFVVHGGIGFDSANATFEEINQVERAGWQTGLIEEMLWADPSVNKPDLEHGWRGTTFGVDATKAFLAKHKLQCLVRSHEVQQEGYKIMHDGKCISVFSAPNYCGLHTNKAAVVRYVKPDSMEPKFVQFESAQVKKAAAAAKKKGIDYSRW